MTAFKKTLTISALVTATGLMTTLGAMPQTDRFQALRDDARLHSGLTVIAIGRQVHEECPSIEARIVPALAFANGLENHARSLGFSRDEVRDYIDSRAEQDRYTEVAKAYFAQEGYDWDDRASVCALGRAEIEARSQIGRLLRD